MKHSQPDFYNVALKAFVRKGSRVLLCRDAPSQTWDLPGGRIGIGEFKAPLNEILKREIAEELGPKFRYKNKGITAVFRHERREVWKPGKPRRKIFMIGFEIWHVGGEIILSEEHCEYLWTPISRAAALLSGGQRDGMLKYLAYLSGERKRIQY